MTVKLVLLVTLLPLTVTTMDPVTEPAGTVVTSCVVVAVVMVAVLPLKVTASFDLVAL